MTLLIRLACALRANVACPACGFWYDDRVGHPVCVPS
jgi:hypothetical protein